MRNKQKNKPKTNQKKMKKQTFLSIILFLIPLFAFAEGEFPEMHPENITNIYALIGSVAIGFFSFLILLIKLIYDNRKTKDMKDYAEIHEKQHLYENKKMDFIENLSEQNTKKIDKLSEILEQTTKILDFQKKSITEINKKLKSKKDVK